MYLEPLIPDLVSPFASFRERAATSASRPRRFALASPTSRTLHCDGCNHLALGTRSARLCIRLLLVLTVGRVRLLRPPDMEKNSEANSSQPSPHPCCMLPSLQGSNPRSPLFIDAPSPLPQHASAWLGVAHAPSSLARCSSSSPT
jgi:hypothetical protein